MTTPTGSDPDDLGRPAEVVDVAEILAGARGAVAAARSSRHLDEVETELLGKRAPLSAAARQPCSVCAQAR